MDERVLLEMMCSSVKAMTEMAPARRVPPSDLKSQPRHTSSSGNPWARNPAVDRKSVV